MANIFEYLKYRGDLSFSKCKFNELDAVIFSELCMIDFHKILKNHTLPITLKEAYDLYSQVGFESIGLIIPDDIYELFRACSIEERFANLEIVNYVDDIDVVRQIQFSALELKLTENTNVIALSGTDDTLIGWKENLQMLSITTASENEVLQYLDERIKDDTNYYICGHSKGGHLTIFSTLFINDRCYNRIKHAYSFDGPGLTMDLDYNKKRVKKITSVIPQTSIIGLLFTHPEEVLIASSLNKGLYQHDIFSWEIDRTSFSRSTLDSDAIHINEKINATIEKLDDEQKKAFSEIVYRIVGGDSVRTLTELNKKRALIMKNYLEIDFKSKLVINKVLTNLLLDKVIFNNLMLNISQFNKIQVQKRKITQYKKKQLKKIKNKDAN